MLALLPNLILKKTINTFLVLGLITLLTACGGGGGGNSVGNSPNNPENPATYRLSGALSGLNGSAVALVNNGRDAVSLSANGDFTFATELRDGDPYYVSVASQPAGQVCSVAQGTGTIAGADVANVTVSCQNLPPATYTVGGVISGLTGSGLVIANGASSLPISGDGGFTLLPAVSDGSTYNVTITTQPTGQQCTVIRATGTVSGANVGDILVSCQPLPASQFRVGGYVAGLIGGGLVLRNNGGDDLAITADGNFQFVTALASNSAYNATVQQQPPGQRCSVISNGSGTIGNEDIINVVVLCVGSYQVGGSVSGLTGNGLVLRNKGGDDLAILASGNFAFATPLVNSESYQVAVANQPSGQLCAVNQGTGLIAAANVTSVSVTCLAPPTVPALSMSYGLKKLAFTWNAVSGANYYQLLENPDGVSGYSAVGGQMTAMSYDHEVNLPNRINARYMLSACNAAGCTDSNIVLVDNALINSAIGYFKSSNPDAGDRFGTAVALSSDGRTLAVGANIEGSAAGGINSNQSDNSLPGAGAVYVFVRDAVGAWRQQAYIKAAVPRIGAWFGYAVALSNNGDTLAVGAPREDIPGLSLGAAYIYARNAQGQWRQLAQVLAPNRDNNDYFGLSVALSGDGQNLAVGAPREASLATGIGGNQSDNSGTDVGAVYVYARDGADLWPLQAYVKASNAASNNFFGVTLALSTSGDTLAVGAHSESSAASGINGDQTNSGASGSGAVYLYGRQGGVWQQQTYFKASNAQASDGFGIALALSGDGDTLAVGAPGESSAATGIDGDQSSNGSINSGAVYLFRRGNTNWAQLAYIKASNAEAGDLFGSVVALSGDGNTLAVSALWENSNAAGVNGNQSNNSATRAGAVYFYRYESATWRQQAYIKASNTEAGDGFGGRFTNIAGQASFPTALALSSDGETLAIGASEEDSSAVGIGGNQGDNGILTSGAVYLY